MELVVCRASELGEQARARISDIFVDGFMQWLQFFSKDAARLSRAFAHMFVLDAFYVAVVDGDVAGIAACTDGKSPSIRLNARELRRHLGLFRGTIASAVLKRELENHLYPFRLDRDCGSVEIVATDGKYRGKGVAAAVIGHIFTVTPYASYVLEVADTNDSAIRLYQKLGFKEFLRVPQKYSKQSSFNYYVYMKFEKE